ncbi:MAG: hypothetical protein KC731_23975, partial [Myxococcales bacterium]|nr:hypothetical protein [Myxococcales bacterium]
VCCDGPCSGLCEACNVAGSLGSCTFVAAGLDPGAECSAGACDGSGGCKLDLGEICGGPGDCLSGLCVDGVCCDDLCNGTCEACGSGTCTPHLSGTDPEAECGADVCGVGGACRCNDGVLNGSESDIDCGGSTCAACAAGMSCNGDADCASDVCLGNVCQPPICGDGKVNGSELCDVADPLTPCCAPACNGTAPAGVICGSDPDGSGCQAAPSCDGLGQGPASCLAGDEPNGTFCTDDTVFCNGAERCQGGLCLSDGDPCNGPDGDPDCNESCDEGTQSCTAYDGDGAPCLDGAFTVCNGGSCSQ